MVTQFWIGTCPHCRNYSAMTHMRTHHNDSTIGVYTCDICGEVSYAHYPSQTEERNVATVNFCERHSAFGKSTVMGALNYRVDESGQWHKLEICPDCVADLVAWVEAGKSLPASMEPYTKPWTPETPAREPSVTEQLLQRLDRLLAAEERDRKALTNGDNSNELDHDGSRVVGERLDDPRSIDESESDSGSR